MTSTATRPIRVRTVIVRDLELMASIGVYEVEHRYEQRIVISVTLTAHDTYDGISERLDDVLDYSKIVHGIEGLIQSRHYKLLETLAERIAELCLADAAVLSTRVRIEKPDIMASCRAVGIEIDRGR